MTTEPVYVLVCGSRRWQSYSAVMAALVQLAGLIGEFTVVEGGAVGADQFASRAARELCLPTPITVPAEWDRYGRAAGPIRNIKMLNMEPAYVLAFWMNGSRGTQHTITNAVDRYRVPTVVYNVERSDNNASAISTR